MIAGPTIQLLGWAASRAAEAAVDRIAAHAARKARAHVTARARKLVSEKRQHLSRKGGAMTGVATNPDAMRDPVDQLVEQPILFRDLVGS